MTAPTIRRILVMGCSRSGTTLLQGLLASHPRVHTFPETGVFLKAYGMRGRLLPWVPLGITLGKERKALAELLSSQEAPPAGFPPLPTRRFSLSRSMKDVGTFLDHLAAAHGKDVWVEKTPRHVFHARRIKRALPGSCCLHIVRRGEDVVASIVHRAQRFPDRFPRQRDPAYGIRQWNRSMRATWEASREPGHVVVFFEELVREVETTMRRVCDILGLEYEPAMATPADPSSFTHAVEEWKAQAPEPVRQAAPKFRELFDRGSRDRIAAGLETALYDGLWGRARKAPAGVLVSGSGKT
jgi:hypothetical protein